MTIFEINKKILALNLVLMSVAATILVKISQVLRKKFW